MINNSQHSSNYVKLSIFLTNNPTNFRVLHTFFALLFLFTFFNVYFIFLQLFRIFFILRDYSFKKFKSYTIPWEIALGGVLTVFYRVTHAHASSKTCTAIFYTSVAYLREALDVLKRERMNLLLGILIHLSAKILEMLHCL